MSTIARLASTAAAAFVGLGAASGALIDRYGGVAGTLEWALRTAVIVAAVIALGAGLVVVVRVRHRVHARLFGGLLALLAGAAFAFFDAQPVAFGVYLTHLPTPRAVHDVDLGATKRPVTLHTATGSASQTTRDC